MKPIWSAVFCVFLLGMSLEVVAANEVSLSKSRSRFERLPICGVLSVHIAVTCLNKESNIDLLLNSKFISDPHLGSSSSDVNRMATSIGLVATEFNQMDSVALASLQSPTLLYLRRRSDKSCGGHWITYLGSKSTGELCVFDPLKDPSLHTLTESELLTLWEGRAIVISNERLSNKSRFFIVTGSFFRRFSGLLAISLLVFAGESLFARANLATRVMVVLVAVALVTLVFQMIDDSSILNNQLDARWMCRGYAETSEADFGEFQTAMSEGMLVDARTESGRQEYQIECAVHIGVDFDLLEFKAARSRLRRGKTAVVFCNSMNCNWAKNVARKLFASGVKAKVFTRGVEGYLEETFERESDLR